MAEIKISVIIPIYNCENYIRQCIESVERQTIKEIEIICVDDGSTDDSASIIQECSKHNSCILLLSQPNQGPGLARNNGIQKAKGEYIAFLDADDYYVDEDALEKMIEQCEKNQLRVCGSFSLKEDMFGKTDLSFGGEERTCFKAGVYSYQNYQRDYGFTSFIFNKNFLITNSIFFPQYRQYEDPPFLVRALHCAKKFGMADTVLYCYRVPSMTQRYSPEKIGNLLDGIKDNLIYAKKNSLNMLFERTLNRLEYEYKDVIIHNLNYNVFALKKLCIINEIVQDYYSNYYFIVRPLAEIMNASTFNCEKYEEELLDLVKDKKRIAVYGAGKFGKLFLLYLKEKGLIYKVKYVLVSCVDNQRRYLENIPIISIQEVIDRKINKVDAILIAAGGLAQKEIIDILNEKGYTNYRMIDNIFLSNLENREFDK